MDLTRPGMDGHGQKALKLELGSLRSDIGRFTFGFCPLRLALDLTRPGMGGQWALRLELGPLKPDMGLLTFEFCPLRLAIGLIRRGMDGQQRCAALPNF